MEERRSQSLRQRWEEFRPSKTMLFWSCVGAVVLTLVVGFSWGGWVTGGTAKAMAEDASEEAYAQLAGAVCVARFTAAADAQAQLTKLKQISSSYRQRDFVEQGGWAVMPGSEKADRDTTRLCAEELAKLELAPEQEASEISDEATVAQ